MANAERIRETTIRHLEILEYADGDITIQHDSPEDDSLGAGFVLAPAQADRLTTIGNCLLSATDREQWQLGENCVGDRTFLRFLPQANPAYALGNRDQWLEFSQQTLEKLTTTITTRDSQAVRGGCHGA